MSMKLSCTQENLKRGLSIVSHLPTKSLNLPILHNVLLRAQEKTFTLSATNLELAITVGIRGKVDEPGEFTVPGKLFSEYVSLLPRERVDLSLEGVQLGVKCGTYETKIRGIPATEFPLIPSVELKQQFVLEIERFKESLSQVLFAVASHESRPELCGVFFRFEGDTLTMASTDSFRLAERIVPLREPTAESLSCIVPARTLTEVLRILGVLADDIEMEPKLFVGVSDNQVVFRAGDVEVVSRTIEGQYPDYRVIIPTQSRTEISVMRDVLIPAVKNASLFSRSGLFDVTLKATPQGLVISSSDQQTGENSIVVEADIRGDENTIIVNHRFLLDGIGSMNSEKVKLKVIDGSNPVTVVPESDARHIYIVMPIKQ